MRVAYIIGTLRTQGDGAARVLLTLAAECQRRGVEAVIITGHVEDRSQSAVPVVLVPSVAWPLDRAYRVPWVSDAVVDAVLDTFRPDVIHVHSPDPMSWAALRYAQARGVRVMATHHTDFAGYLSYYHLALLEPLVWSLLTRLYRGMDVVTAPSPAAAHELQSQGLRNVQTLPWGVDLTLFNPGLRSDERRRQLLGGQSGAIVLCVCRLVWEKDLHTLAQVYQRLRERRDDFMLVVAGEGPAHAELAALMPGAVFLGNLEQQELAHVYASADVLLFPSCTETFGSVTLEALASGLVPVVANAEGSRALVQQGETGFLAVPQDVADFCVRVQQLLDDAPLRARLGTAGLRFAAEFAWERVADRLLNLYAPAGTSARRAFSTLS